MLMHEACAFENDEVFQIPSASIRSGKLISKKFKCWINNLLFYFCIILETKFKKLTTTTSTTKTIVSAFSEEFFAATSTSIIRTQNDSLVEGIIEIGYKDEKKKVFMITKNINWREVTYIIIGFVLFLIFLIILILFLRGKICTKKIYNSV
jgi:hypothetical protein